MFVGLSASVVATFGGLAFGADELGKPHPPFVPEDDPSISVERPTLQSMRPEGATAITAYSAAPKNSAASAPGVVIATHIWGVDAQIRDTVRRFAKAGYRTIAPDFYGGLAPNGDGATDVAPFRPFFSKLADDASDADLAAAAAYVRSKGNPQLKVAIAGFCSGGSIALRQTVDNPRVFSAAAVWYGKVRYGTTDNSGEITPIALAYADDIRMPLLGSYGARDTGIKADDVRALDERLKALGRPHDIKVYDEAAHGFFDDTRNSYVPSAAEDSWRRAIAWFERYLS